MDYPFSGVIVRYEYKDATQIQDQIEDELHINLWEIGKAPFLDIGIKVHAVDNVKAIKVVLPWNVKQQEIDELGCRIDTPDTLAAIFNEEIKCESNKGFTKIIFEKNNNEFVLLKSNVASFALTLKTYLGKAAATEISIPLENECQACPYPGLPVYIRFRVRLIPKEIYCSTFKQRDKGLLSSSIKTRIIDFRINVRRGVPKEILLPSPSSIKYPKFKKIHFFITLHRSETCEFQNENFVGCRSLTDEGIWDEYIKEKQTDQQKKKIKDCLAYQWTAKSDNTKPAKDLLLLGRFSRTITDIYQVIRFIALIVIMGMLGSAYWESVKESSWPTWVADYKVAMFISIILLITIECDRFIIDKIGAQLSKAWTWSKRKF